MPQYQLGWLVYSQGMEILVVNPWQDSLQNPREMIRESEKISQVWDFSPAN